MLRMSVALTGTIGVFLLAAGSSAMRQIPDLILAAQMNVGTGTYPNRFSAATYGVYTGMSSSMTGFPGCPGVPVCKSRGCAVTMAAAVTN
jgi:hypothetical protein